MAGGKNTMSNLIMIYSTTDGHTKKILDHINKICARKHTVRQIPIEAVSNLDLSCFDKIVLGAGVRYGDHKTEIYDFVKSSKKILEAKETFFFSVNLVARKRDKSSSNTNPYIRKFLAKTSWAPSETDVFAGKLCYPKYSFLDRNIIRCIMAITDGPTNTSRCYEFTNWDSVTSFAERIL